jgi:hypothetical protein
MVDFLVADKHIFVWMGGHLLDPGDPDRHRYFGLFRGHHTKLGISGIWNFGDDMFWGITYLGDTILNYSGRPE